MSQQVFSGRELGRYLIDEGMLPPECRNVELLMPANGALSLRYEVFVGPDDLPKLARALVRLGARDTPATPASDPHGDSNTGKLPTRDQDLS